MTPNRRPFALIAALALVGLLLDSPVAGASGATGCTVVGSPSPSSVSNSLFAVSASSASDAWAVGDAYDSGYAPHPLIEHWDGANWGVITSHVPRNLSSYLSGVFALSASDAWAVGVRLLQIPDAQTLIEHWDGTAWRVVPSPNRGTGPNLLYGVAGASASDVWAVGRSQRTATDPNRTLIEHWDGSSWKVVPSPNVGTGNNYLDGVAALGPTDAWAVGVRYSSSYFPEVTLIEHWDGVSWSLVRSPDVTKYDELLGVAAISANDAWAVGYGYTSMRSPAYPLIEHWDGKVWLVVPAPSVPEGTWEWLFSVSARASDDVWAVGQAGSSALVLHWDGAAWSEVPSLSPAATTGILEGVSAVPGAVWTVGNSYVAPTNLTLTEVCA